MLERIDGADGDDPRISRGPGQLCRLVIAGRGHDDHAVAARIVDGADQYVAGIVAAQADVDELRPGVDRRHDGLRHGENVALGVRVGDTDAEDADGRRDPGRVRRHSRGQRGHRGAVSVLRAGAGGGAQAEVQIPQAPLAERAVGRHPAVEHGDGHTASPLAVIAGDAEEQAQFVAQRHQIHHGAILLGRRLRDVDVEVGAHLGVVRGVGQQVGLQAVE